MRDRLLPLNSFDSTVWVRKIGEIFLVSGVLSLIFTSANYEVCPHVKDSTP